MFNGTVKVHRDEIRWNKYDKSSWKTSMFHFLQFEWSLTPFLFSCLLPACGGGKFCTIVIKFPCYHFYLLVSNFDRCGTIYTDMKSHGDKVPPELTPTIKFNQKSFCKHIPSVKRFVACFTILERKDFFGQVVFLQQ